MKQTTESKNSEATEQQFEQELVDSNNPGLDVDQDSSGNGNAADDQNQRKQKKQKNGDQGRPTFTFVVVDLCKSLFDATRKLQPVLDCITGRINSPKTIDLELYSILNALISRGVIPQNVAEDLIQAETPAQMRSELAEALCTGYYLILKEFSEREYSIEDLQGKGYPAIKQLSYIPLMRKSSDGNVEIVWMGRKGYGSMLLDVGTMLQYSAVSNDCIEMVKEMTSIAMKLNSAFYASVKSESTWLKDKAGVALSPATAKRIVAAIKRTSSNMSSLSLGERVSRAGLLSPDFRPKSWSNIK